MKWRVSVFEITSIERKNTYRLDAVAALNAARVTLAAAAATANFERGRNSTSNASEADDGEENSRGANEHVDAREVLFTDD